MAKIAGISTTTMGQGVSHGITMVDPTFAFVHVPVNSANRSQFYLPAGK